MWVFQCSCCAYETNQLNREEREEHGTRDVNSGACGMPPSVARAPSLCSLVSKSSQSGARTRCMATRAATSSPPGTLLAESARMGARGRLLATGWAKRAARSGCSNTHEYTLDYSSVQYENDFLFFSRNFLKV